VAEQLLRIYVRQIAAQRSTVQFVDFGDGTRAGLRIRYFARDDRWRLWVLALDGTQLVGPIKLIGGLDLLAGHKHLSGVPQGQLFVYSPDRAPPTKTTVDIEAILFYRGAA